MDPERAALALRILGETDVAEAREIATGLLDPQRFPDAVELLRRKTPETPKRPLGYVHHVYIGRAVERPRDLARYAGDYVDFLTKEAAQEFDLSHGRTSSLGRNSRELAKFGPLAHRELFDLVSRYDKLYYVPAKHQFVPNADGSPPITVEDAVIALLIAIQLGARLREISKYAEAAVRKGDLYSMGGDKDEDYDGPQYEGPSEEQ